jgi:3-oxoacyl-ACP reductase-like protein
VHEREGDSVSFFDRIKTAIFGHAATVATSDTSTHAPASPTASSPPSQPVTPPPAPPTSPPSQTSAPAADAAPPTPAKIVDVAATLTALSAQRKDKLDWRKSIVDLLKLLDLDSSLSARKDLAKELGYGSDMNDSAAMNIWLHKQVMRRLAENGGTVPAELRD